MPLTKIKSLGITDGTITSADLAAGVGAGKFESALFHVRDEKAVTNAGGGSTSGSFLTRTLNTSVTNEISGASLASNQITLPSGTYYIQAAVPFRGDNATQTKLRNITDSSDTIIGTATGPNGSDGVSFINGRFTIAAQKTFEIQYRVATSRATDGLGSVASFVTGVFTEVQIWKVA